MFVSLVKLMKCTHYFYALVHFIVGIISIMRLQTLRLKNTTLFGYFILIGLTVQHVEKGQMEQRLRSVCNCSPVGFKDDV